MSKTDQVIENETILKLGDFFRVEFLNRIDEIVVFRSLDEEDAKKILIQQLEQFTQRVRARHKIELTFTSTAIDCLLNAGYSPQLGARELNRAIEKLIQIPLSMALTQEKNEGLDWVFDVKDNQIILIR